MRVLAYYRVGCVADEKTISYDPRPKWFMEDDPPRLEVASCSIPNKLVHRKMVLMTHLTTFYNTGCSCLESSGNEDLISS